MGGQPRKSSSALQGNRSKKEIQSRLNAEKRLAGNKDNIKPPDFIKKDEIALSKFDELVKELTSVGIISNVDVDLLAVYSDCWSKYVKATIMLSAQDMVEEQENKLGALVKMQNPYIKVQHQYSDKLMKIASLFGLSPADRSKIAHLEPSDKEKKEDPLMNLIKGVAKRKNE